MMMVMVYTEYQGIKMGHKQLNLGGLHLVRALLFTETTSYFYIINILGRSLNRYS